MGCGTSRSSEIPSNSNSTQTTSHSSRKDKEQRHKKRHEGGSHDHGRHNHLSKTRNKDKHRKERRRSEAGPSGVRHREDESTGIAKSAALKIGFLRSKKNQEENSSTEREYKEHKHREEGKSKKR